MQDKRRHFRVNVEVALYVYRLERSDRLTIGEAEASTLHRADADALQAVNEELAARLSDATHLANGAVALFAPFNERLEFVADLLAAFFEGRQPRDQPDFAMRCQRALTPLDFEALSQSKVYRLLNALAARIAAMTHSLVAMAQWSRDQQLFYSGEPPAAPLRAEAFLHNLEALAEQGNWLSIVLVNLIAKLTLLEADCRALKTAAEGIPPVSHWGVHAANLSAGGLAIQSAEPFEQHEPVRVFLQLEGDVVSLAGQVVSCQLLKEADTPLYRVAFAFEQLNADQDALITRFVIAQELAAAHRQDD